MATVPHMKWWGWGVEGVGFHHEDKPTHHHAVGTEHAVWLEQDISAPGVHMIDGLLAAMDPGQNLKSGQDHREVAGPIPTSPYKAAYSAELRPNRLYSWLCADGRPEAVATFSFWARGGPVSTTLS